jgi:putative membrane protein
MGHDLGETLMTQPNRHEILREGQFNPKVRTYWLLSGAIILFFTIAGIPLLPLWFIFGNMITGRYLERMRCVLTERTLQVSKGLFVRVEKTVPLDKITDVGLVHGPIMRHFDLQAISVETAGQSSQGALIKLVGIVDTEGFREAILAQRDAITTVAAAGEQQAAVSPGAAASRSDELLAEIRDAVHRIEQRMEG